MLLLTPHFFGAPTGSFRGGSTTLEARAVRSATVVKAQGSARAAFEEAGLAVTHLVVGCRDRSLVPVDLDVSAVVEDPRHLVFHAIGIAREMLSQFDYVAIIEDDIDVPATTVRALRTLLTVLPPNEVVVPNRIEAVAGVPVCIDLIALPGWCEAPLRCAAGYVLAEPRNRHSGFLFMDGGRFERAYAGRTHAQPTVIIGGYMESALWDVHSSLIVRRAIPTDRELTVEHLDPWLPRAGQNGFVSDRPIADVVRVMRREESALEAAAAAVEDSGLPGSGPRLKSMLRAIHARRPRGAADAFRRALGRGGA